MNPQSWLRRIVRPEAFAAALLGDLEETRRAERARLGAVRAEFRHYRRVASVTLHFAFGCSKAAFSHWVICSSQSGWASWRSDSIC